MTLAKPKKKKKPKVKVLSKAEKAQKKLETDHKALVRKVFRFTGFRKFQKLADKQFWLDENTTSDFDDVFMFENVIVCAEYTTSQDVGNHIKPKKLIYDAIEADKSKFLNVLAALDPEFSEALSADYNIEEFVLKIVYCSRREYDPKYRVTVPNPQYLDYPDLRYFASVTDCIKHSARSELLAFLDIPFSSIGNNGAVDVSEGSKKYSTLVLPEANSNFDPGYKVVSFYAEPEELLKRAYVLRQQGWRDAGTLYQRMISKAKVESMRKHLKTKKRVFVNNIIATLDDDTRIVRANGDTVDPSMISKTEAAFIQIPNRTNTIGLVDGQHRTFCYYEGDPDDGEIKKLRTKQTLLVTGVIYPPGTDQATREVFEARLFLEINSTQSTVKPALTLALNQTIDPFADESIAKRVLDAINAGSGPLAGQIERYWFDENKLKTTSVVRFALKPLVKTSGDDSLFSKWPNSAKQDMIKNKNYALLSDYVKFCVSEIDPFLIAIKKQLPFNLWTPDKKVPGRLITTTVINSLFICLRFLIRDGIQMNQSFYETQLKNLTPDDFKGFHSSQYSRLAGRLQIKFFN